MTATYIVILGALVLALFAIIIWRNTGAWTPPTDRQIQAANAGDTNFLLYAASADDDNHFLGDGHDHGAGVDFTDSADVGDGGGSDGGGGDGGD